MTKFKRKPIVITALSVAFFKIELELMLVIQKKDGFDWPKAKKNLNNIINRIDEVNCHAT